MSTADMGIQDLFNSSYRFSHFATVFFSQPEGTNATPGNTGLSAMHFLA